MKINKTRRRSNGNISRRKYKNINKSRKRVKKTHKKYLVRLKKYNKNNRHRKYYTRRVNRYKRGGAELQQITAPFNFSFPTVNGKITDIYSSRYNPPPDIKIIAQGWGYVTKAGSLNKKNRPEQLIVYQLSFHSEIYYIARCTFSNCNIVKGGITESNMEKPIKVDVGVGGFSVKKEENTNLTVKFTNDKKESYTIVVVKNNVKGDTLYMFFEYIRSTPNAATSSRVAIEEMEKFRENLKKFRLQPGLLAVLVDSIQRSGTEALDKDICFNIISKHIFPLELTDVYKQTSIENPFATMLFDLCQAI